MPKINTFLKTDSPSGFRQQFYDTTFCGEFLSKLSKKDAHWDEAKRKSRVLSQVYNLIAKRCEYGWFNDLGDRLYHCCDALTYKLLPDSTFKLNEAYFCDVKFCPICARRRAVKWREKLNEGLHKYIKKYPERHFIFLTLTVRNPLLSNLDTHLWMMSKAWQRMTQRKFFPAKKTGWLRVLEFTKPEGLNQVGKIHPHYHVLIAVNKSYFNGNYYVPHKEWVRHWRECMGIDYDPSVDIRKAASTRYREKIARDLELDPNAGQGIEVFNNEELLQQVDIMKCIMEAAKYTVKPQDVLGYWMRNYVGNPTYRNQPVQDVPEDIFQFIYEVERQIKGKRLISKGGELGKFIQEASDDLLILKDENDSVTVGTDMFTAGYNSQSGRYRFSG